MLAALARSQAVWGACSGAPWARLAVGALSVGGSRSLSPAAALAHSAAAAPPAADAWRQRFDDIAPGSVLRIDLHQAEADLSIIVGEHEAIELTSSSAVHAQQAEHAAHPGSSVVSVGHAPGAAAPLQLQARGPSRFLSVEASTGGGSVHVEVVQEGYLRLNTHGGSISAPKVKAIDAHLFSGGGAIAGAVTGVDVRLRSGGGSVALRSLVGKKVEVESGGGAVTLGACYADDLDLFSGGGPVHVTNMDCREGRATMRSAGGAVTIDSLDGSCHIDSEGGDVQIQLHDNAGEVSVQSGGGGIQLFLSPGTTGRLRLRNCGRVAARPGAVRLAQPQDDGSLAFQLPLDMGPARGAAPVVGLGLGPADGPAAQQQAPPPSRLQRAAQEAPPPGNAVMTASRGGAAAGTDIVLDAGGTGTISISERSWIDALRQKHQS